MHKKSRIILLFPLLFLLITIQVVFSYWNGEQRVPPRDVIVTVVDSQL
ncbi:MAG: hypothetical protein AAFZ63_10290 [Bacteroidota bacterium]